jgi:hypothetical protein
VVIKIVEIEEHIKIMTYHPISVINVIIVYQRFDTVDSGDNITSYCVCERQAGSSDDLDDFNTVQCNLTESTQ